MATKRESILTAVVSSLTSVTGVSDGSVYRSRQAALSRAESPALLVEPLADTPENPNIHRVQWSFVFQVAVIFRSNTPEDSADSTVESVHAKIMASSTLEALVTNLVPGAVSWELTDADKPLAIVTMQFIASYQTDLNSISA